MTLQMNASRLSYEERRRIAAALASGRGYADIARELGRPRSTISREVARNGGIGRYQANRAQQAAEWRAGRKPGPRPADPSPPAPGDADPLAVGDFEARFAGMMVGSGVPPMMARVLAAMFTRDSGDVTAAELVARLHVSPSSVSKAVARLERRGLVHRERRDRREHYTLYEDVWYRAWTASAESMIAWASHAEEGAAVIGTATPAGVRLETTGRFFRLLRHDMLQAAEHWRRTLS
ncbi:MarR family transcriptional regulator [Phytomonospora sp. NPDC050363]|uniref:GbsR/MarR family transcriptional regulator n=1 Tax=Phytomonospora sp. NPDC050363 TaxID=3155642 RepID=UPI0033DD920B